MAKIFSSLFLFLTAAASVVVFAVGVFAVGLSVPLIPYQQFLPGFLLGGLVLIGVLCPSAGIALLAVSLPIFGNRPSSPQAQLLVYCSSAMIVGLSLALLHPRRSAIRSGLVGVGGNRLSYLMLLYVAISFASLSSIPWATVDGELGLRMLSQNWRGLAPRVFAFVGSAENHHSYSWLSVFLTAQAAFLAMYLSAVISAERAQQRYNTATCVSWALFLGLLWAMGIGLLDFYGFTDLRTIRALDPVVNPGNLQFRLQSTFGHSGWFAEFVTLSVPLCCICLILPWPFWARVTACLSTLILGELVLILTFQRGGWISYPITLLATWAAIYVVRRLEQGQADVIGVLKSSVRKVLISLPITVIFSLAVVMVVQSAEILRPEAHASLAQYVERFQDIGRASDRTSFMKAGYLLGSLKPILGLGSESFCFAYEQEFLNAGANFPAQIILPLHGTAHNLYFQTFSGKGILGVLLLVALPLFTLRYGAKTIVAAETPLRARVVLLAPVCFSIGFLVYGLVQEIFYIQALQVFCFLMFGIAAGLIAKPGNSTRRSMQLEVLILLIFLGVHFGWEQITGVKPNTELAQDHGCYSAARNSQGDLVQWCGPVSRFSLPILKESDRFYAVLEVNAHQFSDGSRRARIEVYARGQKIDRFGLSPGQRAVRKIEITAERFPGIDLSAETASIVVDVESSAVLVPAMSMPKSKDTRLLSFQRILDHASDASPSIANRVGPTDV